MENKHESTLTEAVEAFLQQRINDHGVSESDALQEAFQGFVVAAEELKETLSPAQLSLYADCESAYTLLDGETVYHYYKAGFADAMQSLMCIDKANITPSEPRVHHTISPQNDCVHTVPI